MTYLIQEQS